MNFLFKFIKFALVGGLGFIIDFGLTWIFKEKLKFNKYYANAIGFCAAATSNFYLNRSWTFQSKDPEIWLQYYKFILISLIGLGLNTIVIYLFEKNTNLSFYWSKIIATILVVLWNFSANYFYTFA